VANYSEHFLQAKKNMGFLSRVNSTTPESWDWQVTVSYYIAVHVMNGHLAKTADLHYNTHEKVKVALSSPTSVCRIPDEIYTSYVKLEGLSRRARYLCHEDSINAGNQHFTYDKHLKKAVKNLDKILIHFDNLYEIGFDRVEISCAELKNSSLRYFKCT
jgi:hypothetical protein